LEQEVVVGLGGGGGGGETENFSEKNGQKWSIKVENFSGEKVKCTKAYSTLACKISKF